MKKRVTTAALLAASLVAFGPPVASAATTTGFTGAYAPSTWVNSITGMLPTSVDNGSVTFSPTTVVLVGGDDPMADPVTAACVGAITGIPGMCQVQTTHGRVGAADTYSFSWTYTTTDISAETDLFGVLVDGVRTILSDPGGLYPTQTGSLTVSPANTFGFFLNCTDCVGGAATATVSNFRVAAVPEPATVTLLFAGAAAVGAMRRGRRPRGGASLRAA